MERETTASGVGPVDAVFKGISDLTETESQLERYQVHAVTAGLDAQGEVSVTIREDGRRSSATARTRTCWWRAARPTSTRSTSSSGTAGASRSRSRAASERPGAGCAPATRGSRSIS